jgi:hypothetical protein
MQSAGTRALFVLATCPSAGSGRFVSEQLFTGEENHSI